MSVGIEGYIAELSMNMAQASVQSNASLKVMKNVMDDTEQMAAALNEQLASAVPPAGAGSIGGLLDARG